jgi:hypothetical protein
MRKQYHQHEPRRFKAAEFEKLERRADVRTPKEGQAYADPAYPGEFFTWHPFSAEQKKLPGNAGVAGEWRMGAALVE